MGSAELTKKVDIWSCSFPGASVVVPQQRLVVVVIPKKRVDFSMRGPHSRSAMVPTLGLFGWVGKSQPGSTKPPSVCLVTCSDVQTRLHEATNHSLAWLQKNAGAGRFLEARLG